MPYDFGKLHGRCPVCDDVQRGRDEGSVPYCMRCRRAYAAVTMPDFDEWLQDVIRVRVEDAIEAAMIDHRDRYHAQE